MKKQYINPETTVVVLDTQCRLMAGSITEKLMTKEVEDGMDFVQSSPSFDLWDWDYEEE